jgi:23S rRNA pseudouridine2457 synthase
MRKPQAEKRENLIYLVFYKPDGVICQFSQHENYPSLADFIPIKEIYPSGRLDTDSEGLLLLTNDGNLSHLLTDPTKHFPKIYYAQIEGDISEKAMQTIRAGVLLKGYRTLPCQVEKINEPDFPPRQKPITPHSATSWIRITLHEGKKRQIRHMTASVGFPTLRLIRVAIGPLNLKGLEPGKWRKLDVEEINLLKTKIIEKRTI